MFNANKIRWFLKTIGIWTDSDQAVIIENGNKSMKEIASLVERFNLHGDGKGFGQISSSGTKPLHRKNNQLKSLR